MVDPEAYDRLDAWATLREKCMAFRADMIVSRVGPRGIVGQGDPAGAPGICGGLGKT